MESKWRAKLDRLIDQRKLAVKQSKQEQVNLKTSKKEYSNTLRAQEIVQATAQEIQNRTHLNISKVVSKCLAIVFDTPYTFEIRFDRKRGRTEAELILKRDGIVLEDPVNEVGLGVIDVASFALRLACISLQRPRIRPLLILDEPFRFVDSTRQDRVRMMMETLCEELGFQVLLITHEEQLVTGKVIEIK